MAAAVVKPESTVRPCPSLLTMFDVLLRYRPRSPRSGVIILGAATGPMHVQCRAVALRMRAPAGTNRRGPRGSPCHRIPHAARALHGPWPCAESGVDRAQTGRRAGSLDRLVAGRSLAPRPAVAAAAASRSNPPHALKA